jgi:hypothetical protein
MTPLNFGHLREVNLARVIEGWNHPLAMWSRDDWAVAVGGELGEAMNILKKLNRERDGITGNDQPASALRDMLGDECADAAIYLDLYAASEDLKLGAAGAELRSLIESPEITPHLGNSPSRHMVVALRAFASASSHVDQAAWWRERGDAVNTEQNRTDAADYIEAALTSLAAALNHFGIDLGAAIVRKFNATSEKHGMPHRLVPS